MLRAGHAIVLCVFALLTLGVVMVNSAGMRVVGVTADAPAAGPLVTAESILLSRSTVYMGLAILALGIAAFLPVRRLVEVLPGTAARFPGERGLISPFVGATLLIVLFCALVYMPGIGREVNGAYRWIGVGGDGRGQSGFSMQPSEVAKWAIIPLVAWYCWARASLLPQFWRGLIPALLAVGAVAGFIIIEDLGTGVLIGGVACLVLLAGGARLWQFLLFVPLGLLALGLAIATNPYRVNRVLAFIDPYADPRGIGYHTIQSLVAIAGGEGFGRGLGHGLQKFGYLPEDTTDFLFAIICEELGLVGAALVISLFLALVWAGIRIVRREPHPMLRLWGLGIVSMVACQALMNLAVVTGMAPTKGIALPLLSSGGTGWILTAFSLGLLVAMDRQRHLAPQPDSAILHTPGAADAISAVPADAKEPKLADGQSRLRAPLVGGSPS